MKKKILIIAYYFTPCNLTPALRTYSWAKYLHRFGYYPIIISRNWDNPIKNNSMLDQTSGSVLRHEKHQDYEVYYLPYEGNIRTKVYQALKHTKFAFVSKFFTFFELLIQNILISVTPFHNLARFAKNYIKNNRDIEFVIISANPYILFKLGYQLHKKFGIKWIADYRDDWTTNEIKVSLNFFYQIKLKYDVFFEKKWVRTAYRVITVSELYAKRIQKSIAKKCSVVENGYFEEDYAHAKEVIPFDEFTITYNGTIVAEQRIEIFLDTFKKIVDHYKGRANIKLLFLGLAYDQHQTNRIQGNLAGYEENYRITERMDNKDAIMLQLKSHLLLMMAYGSLKGIPGSKLYEYIGSRKPVLLFPNDHDVIEKMLTSTGQGIICNDQTALEAALVTQIENYLQHRNSDQKLNNDIINSYSRANQCKTLVTLIENQDVL